MNNIYLFISLLCIIILNCFWYAYGTRTREGFNPGKLIDRALGGIVDGLLGGVPILKDIHKKVKKKKGLSKKIETTFYEFFISLLTIIFLPLGAVFCVYLSYQLFLAMLANIPLLFQPNSLLSFIC